jgi:hypothetical protein
MSALSNNESNTDRIIRIVLAIVIFALGLYYGSWFGLIGLVPLVTGVIGWCPLYAVLGVSTHTMKTQQ